MPRWLTMGIPLALVVAAAGIVGFKWFAPQPTATVDEAIPEGASAEPIAAGTFSAADVAHDVSGRVRLLKDDEGYFLRFEDYDATSGPAVYFFLSESADGIHDESARKLLVPSGEGAGQATLRGNFNLRLGAGFDPQRLKSVIVLCERFDVTFGAAPLG